MTSEPETVLHPSVLQRQANCNHTKDRFIQGAYPAEPARCPHCGESRASWEARGSPS